MRTPGLKQTETWLGRVRGDLAGYCDRELLEQDLRALSNLAYRAVHKSSKPDAVVVGCAYRGLEHLLHRKAGLSVLLKNMNRLLANWDLLEAGMQIPEWDGSKTYTCAVILGIARTFAPEGAIQRYVLKLKLKTGLPAGIIQCAVVSSTQIVDFLQHRSGTAKLSCATEEISGMSARMAVSMDGDGIIRIHEWDCTADQKRRNRDIANRRLDVAKCANPVPCNVCSKTVDVCPLAIWMPEPGKKA